MVVLLSMSMEAAVSQEAMTISNFLYKKCLMSTSSPISVEIANQWYKDIVMLILMEVVG